MAIRNVTTQSKVQPYPLTSLQSGMLFHQIKGVPGVDLEQLVCRTPEQILERPFTSAVLSLVERFPVLQSCFRWEDGEPDQVLDLHAKPRVAFFSRTEAVTDPDKDFETVLEEDRSRGMDLSKAPLIRVQVFAYPENDTRILVTIHHAIVDGRSFPTLLEGLFKLYEAHRDGIALPPVKETVSFRKFVEWAEAQDFENLSRNFWSDRLTGFTAPTPLTVDGLPDVSPVSRALQEEVALSTVETRSLEKLALSTGGTMNSVVQAAWATLLSKYSSETDIVFGGTRACRKSSIPGLDDAVGLFINTLPVRARVSPEKTLTTLFREMRNQWVEMRDHENTPLSKIQSWSEVEKGQALFHSILVFEKFDLDELMKSKGGAWVDRKVELFEKTNFPITVAVYHGNSLRLKIEFDESEFSRATIQRMLGHFRKLLLQFVNHPDREMKSFHLCSDRELSDLKKQWAAALSFPVEGTIIDWFEAQVSKTPQGIALTFEAKQWTYQELNREANRIAHSLVDQYGIRPGDIVGICTDRSPEIVIGILGILKAGGAYLPIDLAYPAERLQWMLEDSAAPVLVTRQHLVPDLPETDAKLLLFEEAGNEATHNPGLKGNPSDLAYVIFTSGSTGKPKGCKVTHRNVVRLMKATEAWYHFDERDVWTLFHSFAFDFSVWEIWGALLYGGRLVVVPYDTTRSPDDFYRLLKDEKVTVLNQTPSAFRQLIEAERKLDGDPAELSLRSVIFGGEALELESLRPWFDRHGDQAPRLVNMYGITETTVHVTYRPISRDDLSGGSVIGVPIPDLEIYIFDPAGNSVPIGIPGEIYVGGAGVAGGYLNRPELTAQRFVPHPDIREETLYRTGDVARYLPGGDLEYLGRCDDQVKIRGFRIELGEIQAVLTRHPAIRESFVTVTGEGTDRKIVAYLVGNQEVVSVTDLRSFAGEMIPPYMIPSAMIFIDHFPLTTNGKIDRKALPEPSLENSPQREETFQEPEGTIESLLAGIWAKVLKLKKVGRNENYFGLGGDSILSIQIVSQARKAGLELKPRHLFDHQTITELAEAAGKLSVQKPVSHELVKGPVPLTPIQRWFFDHDLANQNYWNQAFLFDVAKPLEESRLMRTLDHLVMHHPALRTRYNDREQEVLPRGNISFSVCEELLDSDHITSACEVAQTKLDIDSAKLLSVVYFEKNRKLLVAIHHLAVDGVSWRILLEDFENLYNGRTPDAATSPFVNWARFLSDYRKTEEVQSRAGFWVNQAKLYPVKSSTVPCTVVREAKTRNLFFSPTETGKLFSKSIDARIEERLLAAVATALTTSSGDQRIVIDVEGHGREERGGFDLSRTVGWFTTIYPVMIDIPRNAAFSATVAQIGAQFREIPDRGFTFGLVDPDVPPRDVLFNYLGQFDQVTEGSELFSFAEEDTGSWYDEESSRAHQIEVNAWVKNGSLEMKWTYAGIPGSEVIDMLEKCRALLMGDQKILPLTSLQELYYTLETARPGSGIDQWHWRLTGPVDSSTLHRAWEMVINQHESLRVEFTDSSGGPVQIVTDYCALPFQIHTPAGGETLQNILDLEREKGLAINKAPLMRLTLVESENDRHLIWTHHHLQIDGSSWPVLLSQVSEVYSALIKGCEPPAIQGKSISDYLDWFGNNDFSDSRAFWSEELRDLRRPTRIATARVGAPGFNDIFAILDREFLTRLTGHAKRLAVPVNVIFQAAWSMVLSRLSGDTDIVFGASFSGRPVEIPDVDTIVGTMVNNLPIRVKIDADATGESLVKTLHSKAVDVAEHQYLPLSEIRKISDVPLRYRLFDSLLVYQNYIIDEKAMRWGDVEVKDFVAPVRTNYPFTFVIEPLENEVKLNGVYQIGIFTEESARELLKAFLKALLLLVSDSGLPVGVLLDQLELAKLDEAEEEIPSRPSDIHPPVTAMQRRICTVWEKTLGIVPIGIDENFFDLGGHSLLLIQVHALLVKELKRELSVVDVFSHATIRKLAATLESDNTSARESVTRKSRNHDIAIIGMSGRFPGAESVDEFWENLVGNVESIVDFDDEELLRHGLDASVMRKEGHYVQRRGQIPNPECFDAEFFEISPREATAMDPQQRLFLETAWSALEDAGYAPSKTSARIGVFAGMSNNTYFQYVQKDAALQSQLGDLIIMMGNEKDYLATRTAYKLNLNGPALNIYTACSTSLVAVAEAVYALREGRCEMAIAGAVSLTFPQSRGYYYEEGGITSSDGHCRPFDANSSGTVFSNGMGAVILKPLDAAQRDGDTIHAVIRGVGLNNDGADKVSFTAPSVAGQAGAVQGAHDDAEVDPSTISYVEGHGTATALGDPIEVAALSEAFRRKTDKVQYCGLGSVKSNLGHLDAAAGMAGLIKATLTLRESLIPATLYVDRPNPKLQLERSPFRLVSKNEEWVGSGGMPRRVGVSSFGVGGTNAHLVLEEAPKSRVAPPSPRNRELILLSAKSNESLRKKQEDLAAFLERNREVSLPDLAYTLAVGRETFAHRSSFAVDSVDALITALRENSRKVAVSPVTNCPVSFLFPGQGSQFSGMGRHLYDGEPVFRESIDECAEYLKPLLHADIRDIIFGEDSEKLQETRYTQPALFVVSYSLGRLWNHYGVAPAQMIGHSIGEYSAACLSGVISLRDALALIAKRAALVNDLPGGAMLSIRLPEQEVLPLLGEGVETAALNSPLMTVVAGSFAAIETLERQLIERDIPCKLLRTSHAFHSAMMDPVVAPFEIEVASVNFQAAEIPYLSNVSGDWITESDIQSPAYWSGHVRKAVRFADGIRTLAESGTSLLLEVGPGRSCVTFARQTLPDRADCAAITSLDKDADSDCILPVLGELWEQGGRIDWNTFYRNENRRRISLPTYPFQRKRYWPNESNMSVPLQAQQSLAKAIEPSVEIDRRERLVSELRSQFGDLTGNPDLSVTTSFLNLGIDSLLIGQAAVSLSRHYRTKITFKHLMNEFDTVEFLAGYLDKTLPMESLAPAVSQAAPEVKVETKQPATPEPQSTGFAAGNLHSNTKAPVTFGPFRPVAGNQDRTLNERQKLHLEQLISDYTAATLKSKLHIQDHRQVLADPRGSAGFNALWKEMVYPVVSNRSEGAYLWDIDGNQWIDVTHGFGLGLFGHRPKFVVEAIEKQLATGFEIGPSSPLAGEVATMLCEVSGKDRVTFCNTGSEAVTAAIRVARTVSQRDKIAVFQGSYHGIFDEVLGRPLVKNGELVTAPIAPGITEESLGNILILDYGNPESLKFIERYADELAAVLVEPVQSRRPDLQPREFLKKLRALTTYHDIALVFDEVVTGFRSHYHGAQGVFGIDADLVTYGKVLGGGMPIGALAGRKNYMDALDGGHWQFGDDSGPEASVTFFAGTFVRHPLTLAAAKAVLVELKKGNGKPQAELDAKTAEMVGRMNQFCDSVGVPVKVTRFSSMYFINCAPELKFASLLFYHMRLRRIHIWETRPSFLSLAHSEEDINAIYKAFCDSITALQTGGFFPGGEEEKWFETTPEQKEVLLASAMGDDYSRAFNESITLVFRGDLDRAALRKAVGSVVERHDSLRTIFHPDAIRQTVIPASEVPVAMQVHLCFTEPESAIQNLRERLIVDPFDLQSGPLYRFHLIQTGRRRHELLLVSHHTVCDGWSFGVIYDDIVSLYRNAAGGADVALGEATSFREFAELKQSPESLAAAREDTAYWVEQLTPPPLSIQLPRECKGDGEALESGSISRGVSDELTGTIRRFSRENRISSYIFLFSAFRDILARLSGQHDFCIGTPVASQADSGMAGLCGHGVTFLPIRCLADPGISVGEYLSDNRSLILDSLDHQKSTFSEILKALPGGARISPLKATFTLEAVSPNYSIGGLDVSLQVNPKSSSVFDLSLFVTEEKGGHITLTANYRRSKFSESQVEAWLNLMVRWIERVCDSPLDGTLQDLELGEASFHTESSGSGDVVSCFEQCVTSHPDSIALKWDDGSYTYREVNQLANAAARELMKEGVQRGKYVAITADRSPELIVSMIAILKCGAAYVPIDSSYPEDRIALLLRETNPCLILDAERMVTLFEKLCVSGAFANPGIDVPENLPAYIMFTSGSTGIPKGVMIPHRGITRLVNKQEYLEISKNDVFLLNAPISFDASTLEIWGPLLNGACLAIPPSGTLSIKEIGDELLKNKVTVMWLTAGLFQVMIDERPEALKKLRVLLAGGDVLSPTHVAKALAELPFTTIVNGYGPTENTTFTACHLIRAEDLARLSIPIGKPIRGTSIFLLGQDLHPVPYGMAGELYTGGAGLALGYLNQDEMTSEKFIHATIDGRDEFLYRTGDLARVLSDGNIEFLGRLDNQVKVRGFRIEPGELEEAVRQFPAVRECRVVVSGSDATDKRLIAVCIGDAGQEPALKEYLKHKLPPSLMPAEIRFVESFPLGPNGKIDNAALLSSSYSSPGETLPCDSSRQWSDTENRLHAIWSGLLGKSDFGLRDDFFLLGGHSLLGLRLFNQLHREFDYKKPIATLFEHPSIAELAADIDRVTGHSAVTEVSSTKYLFPLKPRGSAPPLVLIHGGDGGIVFYRGLAQKLESMNSPIFALESPALSDPYVKVLPFDELVESYISTITDTVKDDHFFIGGYSFGGVVAFEIARRLQLRGKKVDVVLIDSSNPVAEDKFKNSPAERALALWKTYAPLSPSDKVLRIAERIKRGAVNLTNHIVFLNRCRRKSANGEILTPRERGYFLNYLHRMQFENYQPKGNVNRALLIQSTYQGDSSNLPEDYGWGKHVTTLVKKRIPGNHYELFEDETVALMAPVIEECLADFSKKTY